MPGTNLTDIIIPELFNPYVVKRTSELSELVTSGIITSDSEFDRLASQAAPVVNMPFYTDLTGESEQIIEDADLVAKKILSKMDVAAIYRRAAMWSATDLSAAMSGYDPMRAIGDLVSGFWVRDKQKELLAILKGVFSSPSMSEHILDISALSGNAAKFTATSFIDAQQLLGDAQASLTAVMLHSATRASLYKQNQIEVIRPSENPAFETYQGKRVIVDDGCPVDGDKYTSYLFGAGAIAEGNGNPEGFIATELDRDKKKGSGVDYLINRQVKVLHPRGIKFTGANVARVEGPSRTEFANGANWERVYEPKQIRIVEFIHKNA